MPACTRFIAWLALAVLALSTASAEELPRLDADEAVRASQAVVGKVVGDYTLVDRDGRPAPLASWRGKPLLVSFIYSGCFQVCPATTRSLDETVQALHERFGESAFNVVSIGFNQPADTPQAMKAFALQQRIGRRNWEFLSAPAALVPALTREFGFQYAATPAGFDHILQVTLVDAGGRIVQQVYGDRPAVQLLSPTLSQLVSGAPAGPPGIGGIVERIRILCTVYDPASGTYRVDYSLVLEIAGGVTFILAMALYMLNERRQRRRERGRAVLR